MSPTAHLRLLLVALAAVSAPAAAQQFVEQPGAFSAARWSEGVECADVDNDGDIDLFFANGDGFMSPGTKRQNVLVINGFETAPNTFANQSVARLGVHESNAKMVITGDIQNDGYADALFCNAFLTDKPFLYVNRAAAMPGFFTFEGDARGFTTLSSAGSGQFGDVDDDGDLDVLLADAYFTAAAKPHLYVNDGLGFFTEDAGFQAAAVAKSAQMDVQLADVDDDFDLDFVGACRAENGSVAFGDHYLMINDGAGGFTDASNTLLDGSSGGVYEIDLSDLDGDGDLDMFFISLSSFNDGPVFNELAQTGSVGFTAGTALSGNDDNEVAFLDFDNDADLDALIGSLGPREKMLVNDGSGSFALNTSVIQTISDSTLDVAVADLDNDGAYDIVTAQGESNPAQWDNKYYRNTGAPDTLAPVVVREQEPKVRSASGPWVVHAQVRDQVMDDGQSWVDGAAFYVVTTSALTQAEDVTAGGLPSVATSVGTTVTWTNQDAVAHSIVATDPGRDFDSGSIPPGGTYTRTFVREGTYGYADGVGGLAPSTVVVGGTASVARTTYSGGATYRVEMADTAGGAGRSLAYELRFTDGAGNATWTESRTASLAVLAYGCGANPPGSLCLLSGEPAAGTTMVLGVDNPVGTQAPGSVAFVAFAAGPDPNFPCGTPLPAFGMDGPGELLISLAPPNPVAPILVGFPWSGPGVPVPIDVAVPADPALVGQALFAQGLLLDPSVAFGVRFGLTEALAVTVLP